MEINIIHPGYYNTDSGPDFLEGKVIINGIEWAGHIEIHTVASDWFAHNHHRDPAYNNVILHVIWTKYKEVVTEAGNTLPTVVIGERTSKTVFNRYQKLNNLLPIPCSGSLNEVKTVVVQNMMEQAAVERIKKKSLQVKELLKATKNHWETVTLRLLLSNMGMNKNQDNFYLLSRSIPWTNWMKLPLFQKEALLFGQAGFLKTAADSYSEELQREYHFLKYKWNLTSVLEPHHWQFMRMRPASFPTRRLAQFCSITSVYPSGTFDFVYHVTQTEDLNKWLSTSPSEYWSTHYRFGSPTTSSTAGMGQSSVDKLVINALTPLIFTYGQLRDDHLIMEKALNWIQELPPESNEIVKHWSSLGVKPQNCWESQGLIQLYKLYCINKLCLRCKIGSSLLINKGNK